MSTNRLFIGGKTKRSNSKQLVTNPNSARKRFSSLCSPSNAQCVFCEKFKVYRYEAFTQLLKRALFAKYSSSQNYYYTKDINDILEEESTPAVVFFRDLECIVEDEEYLKRSYHKKDSLSKMQALAEYYKYHKDIPRLYMQKVYITINKFHEKKRYLEYAAVKKRLNIPDSSSPQKKMDKKTPHHSSYDDLKPEQLVHLLRDLKLDKSSRIDISSSMQLKEIVSIIGKQCDQFGQISDLQSVDYSTSFLMKSIDQSSIKEYIAPNLLVSKNIQPIDSQKPNFNKLQQINLGELLLSTKIDSSLKTSSLTKRSAQYTSPQKNQQQMINLQSQIEGFAHFVQNSQLKLQKSKESAKPYQHQSSSTKSNECVLQIPNRQTAKQKQPDILVSQMNFLKEKVVSQLQFSQNQSKSISKNQLGPQKHQPTDRTGSLLTPIDIIKGKMTNMVNNTDKLNTKVPSLAIASIQSLQLKQIKKKDNKFNKDEQGQMALIKHYRTKSTDILSNNYKISQPKLKHETKKDFQKIANNLTGSGVNKKNIYNINQNNIINIYIEDLKSAAKLQQNGSQTARISSPIRNYSKETIERLKKKH